MIQQSPAASFEVSSGRRYYVAAKSIVERFSALVLLIPALPAILFLVMLVRLTSRGPGLFGQVRVGKGGKIFTMYKIRSMRVDAEAKTGPVWAGIESDPRVTRLGYWLRKLHLDELPQLFNVLRGEMSLIGPRPERPEFVTVLAEKIPGYLDRLRVLPGITGLAQVNFPPDTDLDSVRRKLVLDLEYIATASPSLDFRILLSTTLRIFGLRGGKAVRMFGLTRTVNLDDFGCDTSDSDSGEFPTPPSAVESLPFRGNHSSEFRKENSKRCEDSDAGESRIPVTVGG